MKNVYIFLTFMLIITISITYGQQVGDYGSAGSGNWGTTGTNWVVCQTEGTWADAIPASTNPDSLNNVWIRSGHTIIVEQSPKYCKNLFVENGAQLYANSTVLSPRYVRSTGSVINVDGIIGKHDSMALGLYFLNPNRTITITGNGDIGLSRIQCQATNQTIVIDANVTLYFAGSGGSGSTGLYITNSGYNLTVIINSNKTLTMGPNSYLSTHYSSATNNGIGNLTLNVYGTLTTSSGAHINLNQSSYNSILNVYNGGIVKLGANLNANNLSSGSININVHDGGRIIGLNGSAFNADKAVILVKGVIDFGNSSTSTRNIGTATVDTIGRLRLQDNTFPTGTITFNTGATVEYYGSTSYALPTSPTTYSRLQINNNAGVSLASDITVTNLFTLSMGNVTTGQYTLTANSINYIQGYVIGALKTTLTSAKSFLVGVTSSMTPVIVQPVGSGEFTVRTHEGKHPNRESENVLGMYWTLQAGPGISSATVTLNYPQELVNGNEASYDVGFWNGSNWSMKGATIDAENNTATMIGLTTFGEFTLGEGEALPVELTSFTASQSGNGAVLRWSTATEVNSAYFEILRRRSGSNEVMSVGKVQSKGNSNTPTEYTYTDKGVGSGRYVYELKEVDVDGTSEMVGGVEVEIVAPKELTLGNYPNPFNPQTNVEFTVSADGNAVVKVYNIIGQEVSTLYRGGVKAGEYYRLTFDGQRLTSGIYYLVLETNGQRVVKKMLLMK